MIQILRNNHGTHLSGPLMDYTLCGDAYEGGANVDELTPAEECPHGTQITCKRCLKIIRTIKEYLKENQ